MSEALYDAAERLAMALFAEGTRCAESRGLILVDTKYELAQDARGRLVVIDEIHTPDSSRYWYRDAYERAMSEGRDPEALDKEYVRRWLGEQGYHGEGPIPEIPVDVRCEAARRYIEAFEQITAATSSPTSKSRCRGCGEISGSSARPESPDGLLWGRPRSMARPRACAALRANAERGLRWTSARATPHRRPSGL